MNKTLSHKLPALLTAFCLLLICLLTALPTDVLADTTIEEDQQALNDLEAQRKAYMQQLEALQAQINASKNEEKTLLAEKSELEQEITLLDSSIETNETLMEQYRFQIESNEIALDALEQELADEMEIYGQVLCYYAKYGEASTFEILFSSKSFSDFLTRLDNVGFILEYNNTIVDDITRTTQDIETAKAQNEAYLAQCTALSEELAVNRAAYDERTAELESLLSDLSDEQLKTQSDIEKLKAEDDRILQSIQQLQEQIDSKESFTPSGSGYSWPFAANVTSSLYISSPFEWRTNPVTNRPELHKGIDIPAPYGTPIQAVMDGVVIESGYSASGYGNYVIIYHGNGMSTMYAHCSKRLVNTGAKVLQNQVIARVGSTGQSTGNHLHIAFIKDSTYYNPADFLPADMLNKINTRGLNLHSLASYTP